MAPLRPGVLTIGIPTYNGGASLRALLSSINNLGLAEQEYEVLIVNNCSTDNTAEVVTEAKQTCNNIRYICNEANIGRIANWNEVIKWASGEFLLIMNSNDLFEQIDLKRYIKLLTDRPEVALLYTDLQFSDHIYPAWQEEGTVDLSRYLKKTMLETEYLEFHSLGLLQQHIFRTAQLKEFNIFFDPQIPRTTDRVFVAEAIKAGGGTFYYVPRVMVSWHMNSNRYHHSVHKDKVFNMEELWGNEYKANIKLAQLAGIPLTSVLKAQLKSAAFHVFINKFRKLKKVLLRKPVRDDGMEVPTAHLFYKFLKTMAELNRIRINTMSIRLQALRRVATWYMRSLKLLAGNRRTLSDILTR